MGFAEFKALLKKVNLKPKGVKEIVLEVSDHALDGKVDTLAGMIDGRVAVSIDSEIVRYNIQINPHTERPTITYRVNESGLVEEVKSEGEQAELDLEIPSQEEPTKEEEKELERSIIEIGEQYVEIAQRRTKTVQQTLC